MGAIRTTFHAMVYEQKRNAVAFTAGNNRLAPCPKSPNCFSFLDSMGQHGVEPLRYTGNKDAAYQKLVNLIASQQAGQVLFKCPYCTHATIHSENLAGNPGGRIVEQKFCRGRTV